MAATLALVIAIAVVIAIVLGTRSPAAPGSNRGHDQASGATTVQRRDLVETDTESGTLSYSDPETVYNRLSGTITWLPSAGQVIKPGQALFDVGGQPVILMNGTTPAYRDLNSSDSDGPDILELNRNLIALGFNADGIVADDVWQAATTDGVELFQESLGETETGDLKLGQVVFLPHDRVVSTVDVSLGSTGSGGGSSAAGQPATGPEFVGLSQPTSGPGGGSQPAGSGQPQGAEKKKKKHKPPTSTNAKTLAALLALLRAQQQELRLQQQELNAARAGANDNHPSSGNNNNNSGNHSNSGNNNSANNSDNNSANNSAGGGSGTAVLETNATQLVVTVDLDATKQSEAQVGEPVTVEMPAGNTVSGRITAVSRVAQSSSNGSNGNGGNGGGNGGNGNGGNGGNGNGNGGSNSTIPVTIALSGRTTGAGLDQAAVSVSFSEARANGVLSVPVTALLAVSGGNYAVQEASAPHSLIPVSTGLFAAGYVQISGPGIYPGLAVTDSQG